MAAEAKTQGNNAKQEDDAPLIDLNEASIKKLISKAKRRGYITIDELNEALPQDQMSTDQIEDIQTAISDMGVQIVENDEDAQDEEGEGTPDEIQASDDDDGEDRNVPEKKKPASTERTDDPVRMYLREMGAVELLSREGEIAIAKRIEAGRDTMIMGLCESPITFHAIIQWSEALNNEEMQLREILDLDAMLSKEPPVDKMEEGAEDDHDSDELGNHPRPHQRLAAVAAALAAAEHVPEPHEEDDGHHRERDDGDDGDNGRVHVVPSVAASAATRSR